MRIVFFASGGPGHFAAACSLAEEFPGLLEVRLLVCDRRNTPSSKVARENAIEVLEYDWIDHAASLQGASRADQSRYFHDQIHNDIVSFERRDGGRLDLAVLAYRQIIRGTLLERFEGACINQHPADLSVRDSGGRRFTGIGGHARALRSGQRRSCTSTILVRDGIDNGEILCRGPFVPFAGAADDLVAIRRHEEIQKARSDWPSLKFALAAIATGRMAISNERHDDGCFVMLLDDSPLPYGGAEAGPQGYRQLVISAA